MKQRYSYKMGIITWNPGAGDTKISQMQVLPLGSSRGNTRYTLMEASRRDTCRKFSRQVSAFATTKDREVNSCRVTVSPREPLAMSGDTSGCQNWGKGCYRQPSGKRAGMLLTVLQCTGQSPGQRMIPPNILLLSGWRNPGQGLHWGSAGATFSPIAMRRDGE